MSEKVWRIEAENILNQTLRQGELDPHIQKAYIAGYVASCEKRKTKSNVKDYYEFLNNTGGNDPDELVSRLETDHHIAQTNLIVFTMAISVDTQIKLLKRLIDAGLIGEKFTSDQWNKLKDDCLNNFIDSGALATNQCPNYLRDAYFRAGFNACKNIFQKDDSDE